MALMAESATGFITGLSVPDSRILVIRNLELEYIRRATGDMKAVASFSNEQVALFKTPKKAKSSACRHHRQHRRRNR